MLLAKLKTIGAVAMAVGVATIGLLALARAAGMGPDPGAIGPVAVSPPQDEGPSRPARAEGGAPRAEDRNEAPTGRIYFTSGRPGEDAPLSGLFALDLPNGTWRRIGGFTSLALRVSPDGRSLASGDRDQKVRIRDLRDGGEPRVVSETPGRVIWSPDGRQLLVSGLRSRQDQTFQTWRIEADGSGRTELPIPETEQAIDWSPDGRWLLTSKRIPGGEPGRPQYSLGLRRADGTEPRELVAGVPFGLLERFSPDSRSVVFRKVEGAGDARSTGLWTIDLEGRSPRRIFFEDDTAVISACWSPDGRWLAVNLSELPRGPDAKQAGANVTTRQFLLDAEGARRRPLDLPHGNAFFFDWRSAEDEAPPGAEPGPAKADAPQARLPSRIFVSSNGRDDPLMGVVAVDPNEGTWSKVSEEFYTLARVSPDGRSLVLKSLKDRSVWVHDMAGGKKPVAVFDERGVPMSWTSNGRHVLITTPTIFEGQPDSGRHETWKVAADGSTKEKLPIPETELVLDASPDGQWLLTASSRRRPEGTSPFEFWRAPLFLMHPDGAGERPLRPADPTGPDATEVVKVLFPRFSPDGRQILWTEGTSAGETPLVPKLGRIVIVDNDGTNRRTLVEGKAGEKLPLRACWSPDGKAIAVSVAEGKLEPGGAITRVEIVDVEGRAVRTLPLPEFPGSRNVVDWR